MTSAELVSQLPRRAVQSLGRAAGRFFVFAAHRQPTLGRLIIAFGKSHARPDKFDELGLSAALKERNRLAHHFYRQHNFRRNSDAGRAIMMQDLESMHDTILKAYKAVNLISGIDLYALAVAQSEDPNT